MSSYAPVWVKQDTRRFPRVVEHGNEVEILSPMGAATQEADARAFAALMRHIKEVDGSDHTVLMMQVENEVGRAGRLARPLGGGQQGVCRRGAARS